MYMYNVCMYILYLYTKMVYQIIYAYQYMYRYSPVFLLCFVH